MQIMIHERHEAATFVKDGSSEPETIIESRPSRQSGELIGRIVNESWQDGAYAMQRATELWKLDSERYLSVNAESALPTAPTGKGDLLFKVTRDPASFAMLSEHVAKERFPRLFH